MTPQVTLTIVKSLPELDEGNQEVEKVSNSNQPLDLSGGPLVHVLDQDYFQKRITQGPAC